MLTASEMLGPEGPLAETIDNFAPREQQQQMADAVENAILQQQALLCEAGTGTGKTFAYLVPALMSGKKIIISTGTRTLQDQLFQRDLPIVRNALGLPVTTALLKGRSNYLCLHRFESAGHRGRFKSRKESGNWVSIQAWKGKTQSGDINEVAAISEDATIWPLVTSTADNCLGQECGYFKDCFMIKARREAQKADIVVINHHLLLADMALREEGFGELLPGANVFILDEAHQLPDVASNFFGVSISYRQLKELVADATVESLSEAKDVAALQQHIDRFDHAIDEFRLALGAKSQRSPWQTIATRKDVKKATQRLLEGLDTLNNTLQELAERSKGLENCQLRAEDLLQKLRVLTAEPDLETIQWFDVRAKTFLLHVTPMDIAPMFQEQIKKYHAAWVLTSATLSVAGKFDFFANRLGLQEAETCHLDSPFDFEKQALCYMPDGLPDPQQQNFTESVLEKAIPVIQACGGRTFILFTSYRALNFAAEYLEDKLDFPLLKQGETPRNELLTQFRELGNAILLGTGSFWEGVDVRGSSLSCVIIDKLPFAAPDDPVLQARITAMKQSGINPFMKYQVPNAVISLKQGSGRLIRDFQDTGVLMLCDPRLYSKPYGKLFLRSLPTMPITQSIETVEEFIDSMDNSE